MRLFAVHTDDDNGPNAALDTLDKYRISATLDGVLGPLVATHGMILCEPLVVPVKRAAHVPRTVTPSQHRVLLLLHPQLAIWHHARHARRVEQRQRGKRNVDETSAIRRSQSVAQDVSNDPRVFAGEVRKRKVSLLARKGGEIARGRGQTIDHGVEGRRLRGRALGIEGGFRVERHVDLSAAVTHFLDDGVGSLSRGMLTARKTQNTACQGPELCLCLGELSCARQERKAKGGTEEGMIPTHGRAGPLLSTSCDG